jgi:hypothetical protein
MRSGQRDIHGQKTTSVIDAGCREKKRNMCMPNEYMEGLILSAIDIVLFFFLVAGVLLAIGVYEDEKDKHE